jgi:hypothetical protein
MGIISDDSKNFGDQQPISRNGATNRLSDAERDVLDTALEKYRPGRSEPI